MDMNMVRNVSKKLMITGTIVMVAAPAVLLAIQEIELRVAAKRTGQPIKRPTGKTVTTPTIDIVSK